MPEAEQSRPDPDVMPGHPDGDGARAADSVRASRMPPDVPLAMDPEDFRRAGHELVDAIAGFLATLPERPVTAPDQDPDRLRGRLGVAAPLPEKGTAARPLLHSAAELLLENSLFNGHPRFFGYITSSPAPIGALADLLAAAVNANVGSHMLAPAATEIESQVVRWLSTLIGYREGCGGLLVSGGAMANYVAFLAARRAMAGAGVRSRGIGHDWAIYGSAETHTWIQKACDLFGHGTDAFRWIDTDDDLRMDLDALRAAVEEDERAGRRPMMVVGAAGTVSTGAVDPLRDIADFCRERGIWFHVDGAYGGFAAAVPGAAPDLDALHLADSIAIDPHKWLYAPIEAGCVLTRDPQSLFDAFSYHPPYYHFGVEATNYVDYGPQNSRGFRALKVWLALRQVGRQGYARMIADDMRLSRRLYERVAAHPELDAVSQALSITTFRYVPRALRERVGEPAVEERLNRLNEALLDRLQKSGEAFVSNAVVRGRYLLRACIVNFNTTDADVDALPEIVARTGAAIRVEQEA